MEIKIRLGKYSLRLSAFLYRKPNKSVFGYTNRTPDNQYVLFLDYDNYELEWLGQEIQSLSSAWGLNHFLVFQSSEKGYHLVCLQKLKSQEFMAILKDSDCDTAFRNVPRYSSYRSWVLRIGNKGDTPAPKYINFYLTNLTDKKDYKYSNAHLLLLKRSHLINQKQYKTIRTQLSKTGKFDKNTKVGLIKYKTGSKVIF